MAHEIRQSQKIMNMDFIVENHDFLNIEGGRQTLKCQSKSTKELKGLK